MIFEISRTSMHIEKPCEEAFEHISKKHWCVDIKSLDQLVLFAKKYEELVFTETKIEIYDDYRE